MHVVGESKRLPLSPSLGMIRKNDQDSTKSMKAFTPFSWMNGDDSESSTGSLASNNSSRDFSSHSLENLESLSKNSLVKFSLGKRKMQEPVSSSNSSEDLTKSLPSAAPSLLNGISPKSPRNFPQISEPITIPLRNSNNGINLQYHPNNNQNHPTPSVKFDPNVTVLEGGSFSYSPSPLLCSPMLIDSPTLSSPMKGVRRRDSLANTIQFAIASTTGKRQFQEDYFKAIPFGITQDKMEIERQRETRFASSTSPDLSCSLDDMPLPAIHHDRAVTTSESNSDYAFFGVYDGHGGNQCADFIAKHLHSNIASHPLFRQDTELAIRQGFEATESAYEEFCRANKIAGSVGSTACIGLIVNQTLWIANVGDSAAILCQRGEPVQLTLPHTLKNSQEKIRVGLAGGVMTKEDRLGHPDWNPKMVNLGITRAFGDFYFKWDEYTAGKPSGLIIEPEIVSIPLTTDDSFLLLASDGFWDVITTRQAINYILQEYSQDVDSICNRLVDLAIRKSTEDNTTVLLVKLNANHQPKEISQDNQINSQTDERT
eukprot:TRINITY_DN6571_c0_g1_i1.p1 TRINITY_DN6571_c0_g1~~TRINITY_DN6571_c0_g1_i1.p1  ORF type:complete len:542 (-),score=143.93 TRINITY_DN6571_c0_g1_i1:154-1779(-)